MKCYFLFCLFSVFACVVQGQLYTNEISVEETDGMVGINTNEPEAQLHLEDIYSPNGKNLLIGDDAFFSDIDEENMVGLQGMQNASRAGLKLGRDGAYFYGRNGRIGIKTINPGEYNFAGNKTNFGSTFDVNGKVFARHGLNIGTGGSYGATMNFHVLTISTNQNMRNSGKPTGFSLKMESNSGSANNPIKLNFYSGSSSVFSGVNNAILDNIDSTPTLTLYASGNTRRVGIKKENPSYDLDVNGVVRADNVSASSDRRWKKEVRSVKYANAIIKEINPISFFWNSEDFPEKNFDDEKNYGVIAQELEKVLPELVNSDEEGFKSVEYNGFIAILIKALQEQQETIENQRNDLKALRVEVDAIKSMVMEEVNSGTEVLSEDR